MEAEEKDQPAISPGGLAGGLTAVGPHSRRLCLYAHRQMPSLRHALLKAVADTPPPAGRRRRPEVGGCNEFPRHEHSGRRVVRLDLSMRYDGNTRLAELRVFC